MSFKRTNYAYESLSQVWFLRVYRAFDFNDACLDQTFSIGD